MAFYPPAPRRFGGRRPEHGEEVARGIAAHALAPPAAGLRLLFEGAKRRLEIHDRGGRQVAALAQPGFQQIVRALALGIGHLHDRQTVPRKRLGRNEVPMDPFGRLEREHGLLPLLRREAGNKPRCGIGHGAR